MIRTILYCAQNAGLHFVEYDKKAGARHWPRPRWCLLMMLLAVLHVALIRLIQLPLYHKVVLQLLGGEGLQHSEGGCLAGVVEGGVILVDPLAAGRCR